MADYNQASSMVTATQAVSDVATSVTQAQATKAQANFAAGQYDFNARLAQLNAEDAVKRGVKRGAKVREYGQQVAAAQKTGFAGGGIDVNFGTAAQVVADTENMAGEDAVIEENNGWREAWGFQSQASNYRMQGDLTRAGGKAAYGQTLATGFNRGVTSGLVAGYYGNEALKDAKARRK